MTDDAGYWDSLAALWQQTRPQRLWRVHSDAVHESLLNRWLPAKPVALVLKTDLFDEAVGAGLWQVLESHARLVVGADLSLGVVRAARSAGSDRPAAAGDVRCLPFSAGTFDAVISNSTLDHFPAAAQIHAALHEIHRVIRSGGWLLLTLDNSANPMVALRNRIPFHWLIRLGLIPYRMGVTFGPRRLCAAMDQAGFATERVEAVMHCPRLAAVLLCSFFERHASVAAQARLSAWLMACERLSRWPTRFCTGHFTAVLAAKR